MEGYGGYIQTNRVREGCEVRRGRTSLSMGEMGKGKI
jgi:hypothetical protein